MQRKSPFIIAAIILALSGCTLTVDKSARNGVLDLRATPEAAPLTGEWILSGDGESRPASVPLRSSLPAATAARTESWTLSVLLPGAGTYALLLPFPKEITGLSLDSERIWAAASLDPSRTGPVRVDFRAASSALIRVEIPAGGRSPGGAVLAAAPFILGAPEAVEAYRTLVSALAGVRLGIFGGTMLAAILALLFSRRGKEFLALAAYLAASLAFFLFRDAPFLGGFTFASSTLDRLYVCAWSLQHAALALLALALFPAAVRGAARAVVLVPPLLLAAAAAALPLPSLGPLYLAALGWAGLIYAALLVYTLSLVLRRRWSALPALCGTAILAATYTARLYTADSLLLAQILEPGGAAVFSALAALMLIRNLGDAVREVEHLTAYAESISKTVKRFIPIEFMDYLHKTDIVDLRLGDHIEKEMTIFFSDIRSFTRLSEDLTTEENFAFINSYLARMVPLIKERGGFVDKYIGDAIMALFPDSGGADQSLRTALEMQTRMLEYNRHRASVGYRPIEMGIGIHTGNLMLGVVGVQDRMENTVISDAVNLSSRLQAIAKAFNIGVVISEQSFKSLDDPGMFKYRFIGKVRVKGKAAPVSCFEIFGDTQDAAFGEKMKANTFFEQGMLSYYQKDFLDATYYFKRALEVLPHDGAARFYLETCLRKNR